MARTYSALPDSVMEQSELALDVFLVGSKLEYDSQQEEMEVSSKPPIITKRPASKVSMSGQRLIEININDID